MPDDKPSPCAVCGEPVSSTDGFRLEVSDPYDGYVEEVFCTWEHLAEWTGRGLPGEFEPRQVPEGGDWLFKIGCATTLILLAVIFVLGMVSAVRIVF